MTNSSEMVHVLPAILLHSLYLIPVFSLDANFNHDLKGITTTKPLVIAHRGASGVYPEHTIPAYQEAIDQGADFIECDVIVSKDLEYLCLHDNWISDVTNVKEVFPDCEETLYVPDFSSNITDCFAHRFTLAQLKTLKVKQSKSTRDPQYDLQFEIPTLQKYLDTAKNADRVVGIYPELKNPNFVRGLSIWDEISSTSYEDEFLEILHNAGYTEANDPCLIQSFDYYSITHMNNNTKLPCVYLRWLNGNPITNQELDQYVKDGLYGIGPETDLVVDKDGNPTDLTQRAHDKGLKVHPWTFRNDALDIIYEWDIHNMFTKHAETGIDGAFVDFPSTYLRSLELLYPESTVCTNGASQSKNIMCFLFALTFLCHLEFA